MYTYKRRVTYSEVSVDHHADVAQIAEYFQDCSCFSDEDAGYSLYEMEQMNRAWLLASWQIEIRRNPEYSEAIEVSTWPYGFDALLGYRNFSIRDAGGEMIVVANSQWTLVDTQILHPVRIKDDFSSAYRIEPKADMEYGPRKIRFKEDKKALDPVVVPRDFIDTNQHMNNAKYLLLALRYVPENFRITRARVEYKAQAVLGDVLTPMIYSDEDQVKIEFINAAGDISAIIEFRQQ